jgi:uncharacterized alpha-E superfamily protein
MWERINATWIELPGRWEQARQIGPASFLGFVKTQVAAVNGLADTTMSRDQTWHFFALGRSLERTDMVARQLASLAFEESGLVTLLRSCGAYEPYLRLSHGIVEPRRVLHFLLCDRLFPRSAIASISAAGTCLDSLSSTRSEESDEARRLVALAQAELEYLAPATLTDDLNGRLRQLQRTISQVSDLATARYFAHDLPLEWHRGA